MINTQLMPEVSLLGLMGKQLEKCREILFVCIVTQQDYYINKDGKIWQYLE